DGFHEGGFSGARFSGQSVDLVRANFERHAVDRPHLALDPKLRGAEVGSQILDLEHCRPGHCVAPPMRARRLLGSMYSFIETASRNRPTNVITTSPTGNAIHHQMPATTAVC